MAVMAKAERADTADAGEIKETSTTATLAVPADGVVVTTSVIGPTAARRQQRQRPNCACTRHSTPAQLSLASLRGRLIEYQLRLG